MTGRARCWPREAGLSPSRAGRDHGGRHAKGTRRFPVTNIFPPDHCPAILTRSNETDEAGLRPAVLTELRQGRADAEAQSGRGGRMVRLPYGLAVGSIVLSSFPGSCWSVYTTSCTNKMQRIPRLSGWHSRTRVIYTSGQRLWGYHGERILIKSHCLPLQATIGTSVLS